MFEKFSGRDSDECGADAVGGVGEKDVVSDWFDGEVEGGVDQELIVLVDGEVVDGVVACERRNRSAFPPMWVSSPLPPLRRSF